MANYDQIFDDASNQYNIDPTLLRAVAQAESSMNPNASSGVANGIMQLTPPTAKALGVNNPNDPAQAIPAAAKLLRQNLDASKGDEQTALLMYHGGTDQRNWGPLTHAYPDRVRNAQSNIVKQQIASNDPVYKFLGGTTASANEDESDQQPQSDATYEWLKSGGKSQPNVKDDFNPSITPDLADNNPINKNFGGSTVEPKENTLLKNLGKGFASLADNTIGGVLPFAAKQLTYAGDRALGASPTDAETASNKAAGYVSQPLGKALGITNDPAYTGEASNKIMQGIGGAFQSASNKISSVTGLPSNDVNNMLGSLSVAVPSMVKKGATTAADYYKNSPSLQKFATGDTSGDTFGANTAGAAQSSMEQTARAQNAPIDVIQAIQKAEKSGVINPQVAQAKIDATSLPVRMDLTEGMLTQDPNLRSIEKNSRADLPDLANKENLLGKQVGQNLDAIKEKVAPDAFGNSDQYIIDASKTQDLKDQQIVSAKYQKLANANGGLLPLKGKDFASAANKALEVDDDAAFLPKEIQGLVDKYADGGEFSMAKFESLRTKLATASRSATDGNVSHAIGVVRDTLESLPMGDEAKQFKVLADDARATAAERFSKFNKKSPNYDPTYTAAVNDPAPIGTPSPLAGNFIQKYLVGGNGSTAYLQRFIHNISGDPMALQHIRSGTMDAIINSTQSGDKYLQSGLNKSIANLGAKKELIFSPEDANTIDKLGRTAYLAQNFPDQHSINTSNTAIAKVGSFARKSIVGATNYAFHGIPVASVADHFLQNHIDKAYLQRITSPTAGLDYKPK